MSPYGKQQDVKFHPSMNDEGVFNARVFNLSHEDELQLYVEVMRAYSSALTGDPDKFFSARDSSIYVLVEWIGQDTFEKEFLEKPTESGTVIDQPGDYAGSPNEESPLEKLSGVLSGVQSKSG